MHTATRHGTHLHLRHADCRVGKNVGSHVLATGSVRFLHLIADFKNTNLPQQSRPTIKKKRCLTFIKPLVRGWPTVFGICSFPKCQLQWAFNTN